jgi:hypothetical protein
MPVCQGCGRTCSSDLCCPPCADLDRSSFFCSQECFSSNWRDHCRLHSILLQQRRMSELATRERKALGMSAATAALSAIQEYMRDRVSSTSRTPPQRVSIEPKEGTGSSDHKDHKMNNVDKLIGRNGVLRGFRVMTLVIFLLFIIFYRINSLLSEIPIVVERKVSQKRSIETSGNQIAEKVLEMPFHGDGTNIRIEARSGIGLLEEENGKSETILENRNSDEVIKNLRGEIEALKIQLSNRSNDHEPSNKTLDIIESNFSETPIETAKDEKSPIGAVRNEAPLRVLKQELGIVRKP